MFEPSRLLIASLLLSSFLIAACNEQGPPPQMSTPAVTYVTLETQPVTLSPKVEVVTVAPLFGEAIRRIHNRESISVLFP